MTPIQSNIIGFSGKSCSLFSAYDSTTSILVISVETNYSRERRAGCILITNDTDIDRDQLFTDKDISTSIGAFFSLLSGVPLSGKGSRILFNDSTTRSNPSNAIERDTVSESGKSYRISEGITNSQVAVLAASFYTIKSVAINNALDMADYLGRLNSGEIITI